MIPEKIDRYNCWYAGFLAIMKACKEPEFLEFVKENEGKENSDKFYFSIYENCKERVFYIYRAAGKWEFWRLTDSEWLASMKRGDIKVVFI